MLLTYLFTYLLNNVNGRTLNHREREGMKGGDNGRGGQERDGQKRERYERDEEEREGIGR